MRVDRIFVAEPLAAGERRALPAAAARHVSRVLRRRPGDVLVLFDGSGAEFDATLEEVRRDAVVVRTAGARAGRAESALRVVLAQALARGARMDYALQKAVELGVACVVPVLTEHGVVRLDAARAARREAHWRAVAISACEQCGRTRIPEIAPLQPLGEWLAARGACDLRLVLDPAASRGFAQLEAAPRSAALLVGPEGGLSPAELERAREHGFTPLHLGPRVLRAETATVAALTALQLRFGDL